MPPAPQPLPPPVRFTFDGLYTSALPEETLLQALSRRRVPLLTRSIKYHRPRGPLCGIGQCAGCLVRVNGVPNVRACRTHPMEGDRVHTENAWPSVRFDVFGALDRVFPRHMDTMHGFRRPLFLRPLYHQVVRRLAGTGRLPDPTSELGGAPLPISDGHASEALTREPALSCDVLVVGGGASGARAARELVEASQSPSVLVLERSEVSALGDGPLPPNLRLSLRTSLSFLPPPLPGAGGFVGLASREGGKAFEVRARSVLLATGAYDAFLLFAGNDRPGVLTGDGALALRRSGGAPPFRRAVLFGAGARARALLSSLPGSFGAIVAPGPLEPATAEMAAQEGVEAYPDHLLLSARGSRRVRSVLLRDRHRLSRTSLRADGVVLAHRRVPHVPLYFQAGARMAWRGATGAYYPEIDERGRTSVEGLFAAGEGAGFVGEAASSASVDRAVRGILGPSEPAAAGASALPGRVEDSTNELLPYYRELLRQPWLGKRVVCPCEDVVADELDEAVHEGFTGTEVIKRYTGAGTGICQGRYCLPDVVLLLSILEGRPPSQVGFITQRPPAWPVPLGDLARLATDPRLAPPATGDFSPPTGAPMEAPVEAGAGSPVTSG